MEKPAASDSVPEMSLGSRMRDWLGTSEGQQCLLDLIENSTLVERLGSFCEWLIRPDVAPGYEAYLVQQGEELISARLNARMFEYFGAAIAREARLLKTVIGHIRAISQVRRPITVSRWAARLNELDSVWASMGDISMAIDKAGLSVDWRELLDLVYRAAGRDEAACTQLKAACQTILPHLPDAKGKPVSAAAVTHALFLAANRSHNRPTGYTSDPENGDFTDDVTCATRQALGLPKFNPRRAHALMKSGKYDACNH